MRLKAIAAIIGLGASMAMATYAQAEARFQGLGRNTFPYEVAGDGSKVVGRFGVREAFWTLQDGWTCLGLGGFAYDVSRDGSVITGFTGESQSTIDGNRAFRWTASTGADILPAPANQGLSISADGTTIVGAWGVWWDNRHPFRYTTAEGTVDMSTVAGMSLPAEARGVSGDGSAVTGWSQAGGWVWHAADNTLALIDSPDHAIRPWAISADGTTVVGGVTVHGHSGAGYWRPGEEATVVVLAYGSAEARDVTADGQTLTGYFYPYPGDLQHALIWDQTNGARTVEQMLEVEYGLDLDGWRLRWAYISDDGRTLAGAGINPMGQDEGWVATIPEPATLSLLALGALALLRRRRAVSV